MSYQRLFSRHWLCPAKMSYPNSPVSAHKPPLLCFCCLKKKRAHLWFVLQELSPAAQGTNTHPNSLQLESLILSFFLIILVTPADTERASLHPKTPPLLCWGSWRCCSLSFPCCLPSPVLSIFSMYFQHKTCNFFPLKILKTKAASGKISALSLYGAIKKRQSLLFSNMMHAE